MVKINRDINAFIEKCISTQRVEFPKEKTDNYSLLLDRKIGALPIDLLKLDTKQEQAKAIEAITLFPHTFDKLLPIVLPLRRSPYPEVVKFLNIKLSELIYDAYHRSLLDDIENLLDESKEDKAFVRPLRDAHKNYESIVSKKESINDLNPYENERDLMDLYYSGYFGSNCASDFGRLVPGISV